MSAAKKKGGRTEKADTIGSQTSAAQAKAAEHGYQVSEPLAIIDEARQYLDAMVAHFVYADGDPERDNRDHRASFNEHAANVAADLQLLRDLLEQNEVTLLRSLK